MEQQAWSPVIGWQSSHVVSTIRQMLRFVHRPQENQCQRPQMSAAAVIDVAKSPGKLHRQHERSAVPAIPRGATDAIALESSAAQQEQQHSQQEDATRCDHRLRFRAIDAKEDTAAVAVVFVVVAAVVEQTVPIRHVQIV